MSKTHQSGERVGRFDKLFRDDVAGVRAAVVGHTPVERFTSLGNVHYRHRRVEGWERQPGAVPVAGRPHAAPGRAALCASVVNLPHYFFCRNEETPKIPPVERRSNRLL